MNESILVPLYDCAYFNDHCRFKASDFNFAVRLLFVVFDALAVVVVVVVVFVLIVAICYLLFPYCFFDNDCVSSFIVISAY